MGGLRQGSGASPSVAGECSPAREYITVMNYLRSQEEWKIPEKVSREMARQASAHCPGSAARLIRVANLLTGSGVGTKDSLYTALRLSGESDELTDRFIVLFKKAYLKSELDLDVASSHKLAASLSVDYGGTLPALEKEFTELVEFCSSQSELAQSKARCARFASELLTASRDQPSGVASRFKRLYGFLTSKTGAELASGRALVLAQEVIGAGSKAGESFMEGYRYAVSKSGLSKSRPEAVAFSRDLVLQQLKEAAAKNSSSDPGPEIKSVPKS